ncbi:MAG TPA: hypothetical protein VMT15_16065 [Bryobacteraceae bacterium]|nr:hypothetical protein [Bryobacteraceae bacterium]
MKLRLNAGSLRLRLSQSEVAKLHDTGEVRDAITFAPGHELVYTLETGPQAEPKATFEYAKIRVILPTRMAMKWTETDQTGIEASTGTLKLLVEKDFKCLHQESEPGEDSFPNPLEAAG